MSARHAHKWLSCHACRGWHLSPPVLDDLCGQYRILRRLVWPSRSRALSGRLSARLLWLRCTFGSGHVWQTELILHNKVLRFLSCHIDKTENRKKKKKMEGNQVFVIVLCLFLSSVLIHRSKYPPKCIQAVPEEKRYPENTGKLGKY